MWWVPFQMNIHILMSLVCEWNSSFYGFISLALIYSNTPSTSTVHATDIGEYPTHGLLAFHLQSDQKPLFRERPNDSNSVFSYYNKEQSLYLLRPWSMSVWPMHIPWVSTRTTPFLYVNRSGRTTATKLTGSWRYTPETSNKKLLNQNCNF